MKMKPFLLLFILSFICFFNLKSLEPQVTFVSADTEKPATIKVLLHQMSSGLLLEVKGPFKVINPENGKKVSSGRRGKRFYLYPHKEGIKWGEDFLGIFQLQILPTSPKTTFLLNGIQYQGAIEIYHLENHLMIINEVNIESFLKSILSDQYQEAYPNNVTDSIAIVARTDAYYRSLTSSHAFWHVKASECGYKGMGLTLQNLPIEKAIENTRYLIMTFQGRPFPAAWTENCAGKTASYQSIFRKNIQTPAGVNAVFAAKKRKQSRWNFSMEVQELAKAVKINRITAIDLFVDHFSNKVYAIRMHDGMHTEDIDFTSLQNKLGKNRLLSNDFSVSIKGNKATFEGYGKGKGTGLCLYSALQMSDRGDDAPKILKAFFPSIKLKKMRSYPTEMIKENILNKMKAKKRGKKKARILH